jgi:thiamine-monophosphate kinase
VNYTALEQLFLEPVSTRGDMLHCAPGQALLRVPSNQVGGVHFPSDTAPRAVGHKCLAVNLSDLAAMGAQPAWVSVAVTLPEPDESWLRAFADGFNLLRQQFNVAVVAAFEARGALAVTVQAYGVVSRGQSLTRAGAKPGDLIYVTGTLGDAGLALQYRLSGKVLPSVHGQTLNEKLDYPYPRVAVGLAINRIANAAIDLSDGLAADLGHILEASGVGATMYLDRLPLSESMRALCTPRRAWEFALSSGDDYELCFTVPADHRAELADALDSVGVGYACVGVIDQTAGLRLLQDNGQVFSLATSGFDHFRS